MISLPLAFIINQCDITECWVVTNTRFTKDAEQYGTCVGLRLLSWDFPKGNSLKDIIEQFGLHPLTCSTMLTKAEKQMLLDEKMVLSRDVLKHTSLLDKIGIRAPRKNRF